MSILYSKVQRVNPRDTEVAKKWYIVPSRVELKDEKTIADALTKNTTLSRGEASLVIYELQSVIIGFLLDDYSVRMGDWGTFNITLSSAGADTKADCTAENIKSVNIRFRPGKEMKDALAKATFAPR